MAIAERPAPPGATRLRATRGGTGLAMLLALLAAAGCSSPDETRDLGPQDTARTGVSAHVGAGDTAQDEPEDSAAGGTRSRARNPGVTVSAKLDTVLVRLGTISARIDNSSRGIASLRGDLRRRDVFGFLMFLLGTLFGALALPRLVARLRTRSAPHPTSSPTRDPDAQARAEQRRAELEAQRNAERGGGAATPAPPGAVPPELTDLARRISGMETSLGTIQTISDELVELRRELRSRGQTGERRDAGAVDSRYGPAGAHREDLRRGRDIEIVTDPSEYRDLSSGERDRGPRERVQAMLNEEGIFVLYPESVSKPMAEIEWVQGETEADGFILTSFLFSLDSRRLQIAYDVDLIDSGRYETEHPARIDWSEGRNRGRVLRKGQLRYVGT